MNKRDFSYIDSNDALAAFCDEIKAADAVAIDTEFIREKTYYARLCLIQVATTEHRACIDPLAITDFSPLLTLLQNPQVLKIFHAPRQDTELFYQQFDCLVSPVFDTQLAAALLGHPEQIGFADIVNKVTGVQLAKAFTRTDWCRRPLSADELDYAMDDVIYLWPVFEKLREGLAERGRDSWMGKAADAYADPDLYEVDKDNLWQKLKGVQKLRGQSLQLAQLLCIWREDEAQKRDKPRRWILADDIMVDIARKKATSIDELQSIRQLHPNLIARSGASLLELTARSAEIPQDQWPRHEKKAKLSANQQALGDCLLALCRLFADQHEVAVGILATRKEIDLLVTDREASALMRGWRYQVVGRHLVDFIDGRCGIRVESGAIVFSD